MNLLKLFKVNQDTAQPIKGILNKDAVRNVISDFVDTEIEGTERVILLWLKDGELKYKTAGFNPFEAIGSLETIKQSIVFNGLKDD